MAIARLTNLTYWYPQSRMPALDDVTLPIDEGVTLVSGPSGGGKSTLLRTLNGLVPHFHGGRIKGGAVVAGLSTVETPTRRLAQVVGFVFQDPEHQAVYDTVEREVAFGLENLAVPAAEMHDFVDSAIAEVGIEHLRGRSLRTLSGGERQRVALASVLAMRPTLVVLDEPTSQLDPEGTSLVFAAVARLSARGRSVVISEHRLEELGHAAEAMVVVNDARAVPHPVDEWAAPPAPARPCRRGAPGPEAWSLAGVTAGHAGRPVLAGVDLAGRMGEVVALAGPNGGGKTTLLRTLAGSLKPQAGQVARLPGRVAYLPQNPTALLHRPSVRAEVELTLEWSHEVEDPNDILRALGLSAVAGRYSRDLSSGERQRAALAAALAGRPRLVLLDEPTRGMDLASRSALIGLITTLRDGGASIVVATHDVELRDSIADRVVDVSGGHVTQVAAVKS